MPMPAILQAFGLGSSANNVSVASTDDRNMYLGMLQHQQASHSGSQLLAVEERLTQAETDVRNLNETCRKLALYLEQYELINQELAAQVIDLQTKLKTP